MFEGKDINQVCTYIQKINSEMKRILKERFVGLYIHGSLAEGDFKWERSDIDMLVVIDSYLNSAEKLELLEVLEHLAVKGPEKGIEISILNKEAIQSSDYPLPFEFHNSRYWYESVMAHGWEHPDRALLVDGDLSSHIHNLHSNHIVVEGPPVKDVFPSISKKDFLKSIEFDEYDAPVMAVDTVMNLCRFDYYLRTGEMVSKAKGLIHAMNELEVYNDFLRTIYELYDNNANDIPMEYYREVETFKHFMIEKRRQF